ncbi:MAG: hypothetical protein R2824_23745 [Saprospiraceae bacterium]
MLTARAALEALLENYKEDQELINIARTKLNQINQQLNNASRLQPEGNSNRLEMIEEGGNT